MTFHHARSLKPWAACVAAVLTCSCAADASHSAIQEPAQAGVAFTLSDASLVPEGIAHDPATGDFFVGSTYKRSVTRITPDGGVSTFAAPDDPPAWGLVGMRVDHERRVLWAATSHAGEGMPMLDMDPSAEGKAALLGFDLGSGEVAWRVDFEDGSHFLNDVAVDADGRVLVTDSQNARLYRFDPASQVLDTVADLGEFDGQPNGIDLSESRTHAFVAVGRGIVKVDLASGEVGVVLDSSEGQGVIDGLYLHQGSLIAIMPWPDEAPVVRYHLDPDRTRVMGSSVLLRDHPTLEQPTTGAVVGDELYVIANSHLQTFRAVWTPEGADTTGVGLRGPTVLRVPLVDGP